MKRFNSSSHEPIDATNAQPTKKTKKSTTAVLYDDVLNLIVPYIESKTLPALVCAAKTTHDAAGFRVANYYYSLLPTMERHFVELSKKDGYSAYFQDPFCFVPALSCLPAPQVGGVVRAAR